MSTDLGMAKVYFSKSDFGKMLKLKDVNNLVVTDITVDKLTSDVEVTIVTPMDNDSSRVNPINSQFNVRYKAELKTEKMYVDFGRDEFKIYYKNKMIKNSSDFNILTIVNYILELTKNNRNVEIYIDTKGIGQSLLDSLETKGFKNVHSIEISVPKCDKVNILDLTTPIYWSHDKTTNSSYWGKFWSKDDIFYIVNQIDDMVALSKTNNITGAIGWIHKSKIKRAN